MTEGLLPHIPKPVVDIADRHDVAADFFTSASIFKESTNPAKNLGCDGEFPTRTAHEGIEQEILPAGIDKENPMHRFNWLTLGSLEQQPLLQPQEGLRKCSLLCALLLCLALPALHADHNTFTGFPGGSINHVFYLGNDNHIYEVYYDNGRWWPNDLTRHTGAPLAAEQSALTSWFDSASVEHVFYISSDGNIHELFDDSGGWDFNNLTSNPAICSYNLNGSTCIDVDPAVANGGALTGYFDSRGYGNLFYEGPGTDVISLTYFGRNVPGYPPSGWFPSVPSVTEQTQQVPTSCTFFYFGCKEGWVWAEANSDLTSFVDGSGSNHVFFLTSNGHVQEFSDLNGWSVTWPDLTVQTFAPAAALNSSMTSFFDAFGVAHVFFQTSDGHVHELYYNNGWHTNDLTAAMGSLPAVGVLTSFFDLLSGQHVFYQGADGHIHELHNSSTSNFGKWYPSDLTTAAGAPSWGPGTAAATALTSYIDNFYIMHVFYRSESGHVIELYYNGHWWSNDLTQNFGVPPAQPY